MKRSDVRPSVGRFVCPVDRSSSGGFAADRGRVQQISTDSSMRLVRRAEYAGSVMFTAVRGGSTHTCRLFVLRNYNTTPAFLSRIGYRQCCFVTVRAGTAYRKI